MFRKIEELRKERTGEFRKNVTLKVFYRGEEININLTNNNFMTISELTFRIFDEDDNIDFGSCVLWYIYFNSFANIGC